MRAERARDVFDVEVVPSHDRRRGLRRLVVVAANLLFEGSGPGTSGSRRVVVTDPATGRVIVERDEPMGDDGSSDFAQIVVDASECSADDFRARWVDV